MLLTWRSGFSGRQRQQSALEGDSPLAKFLFAEVPSHHCCSGAFLLCERKCKQPNSFKVDIFSARSEVWDCKSCISLNRISTVS